MRNKRNRGFTILEMLIVVAVLVVMLGIAGSFSPLFSSRRNIDQITNNISGDIQSAKLQAAREGVEHRVTFNLSPDETVLEIINERGNSNSLSTAWTELSSRKLKVEKDIDVEFVPSAPLEFKPTGEASTDSSCLVKPTSANKNIRCGQILVTRLGNISIIKGNWDGTNCNQIKDKT